MSHLRGRGARESTLVTAEYRLAGLLKPCRALPVRDLTAKRCEALYRAYAASRKPDTHQGALAVARAFGEWARKSKLIAINPWADVEPIGRKTRGKPQHRIDEARKLATWCLPRAGEDDGALAVLLGLLLGLRAGEIVGLVRRDLDDKGRRLWVAKAKTQAGVRSVVIPEVLRTHLTRRAELPQERLLPYRREWVRDQTRRICRLAGVPVVCAHALRGAHATLALEAGASAVDVALSLGHTSPAITRAAYAATGSGASHRVSVVGERLGLTVSPSEEQ